MTMCVSCLRVVHVCIHVYPQFLLNLIFTWGPAGINITPHFSFSFSLSLSLSLSLDAEVLQKEAVVKQKELSKAEKLTKKLHDELQSLSAHMTTNMVSKMDFEHYKRAVNEKVMKIWKKK